MVSTTLHGYFIGDIPGNEEGCHAHEQERTASSGVFERFGSILKRDACSVSDEGGIGDTCGISWSWCGGGRFWDRALSRQETDKGWSHRGVDMTFVGKSMSITKIFGGSSKIDLINHQQTTLFGNWPRERSCRSLINVAAPETLMSILMDGHLQLSDAHMVRLLKISYSRGELAQPRLPVVGKSSQTRAPCAVLTQLSSDDAVEAI